MLKKIFNPNKSKKKQQDSVSAFKIKLDGFLDQNGKFDYSKYKDIQSHGNKEKIENIWVREENIKFLSDHILKNNDKPQFGLCHGTRRGMEQKWFSEYLNCNVIGTEISDTANQFPNTIQWDFHEVKEEWLNNVDFIYSNSLDHSYDPKMCLQNWMKCLKPNGICILEHSEFHGIRGVDDLDPFGAELIIMPYLILEWGEGDFSVRKILDAPMKNKNVQELKFLILENN